MKNKILNLFLILFIVILSSCVNVIENKIGDKGFSFCIGSETAENIERVLSENRNINGKTELKVLCELFGPYEESQTHVTTLENLKNLTLKFDNLPFGNDYYFTLSISYYDGVLYKGTSEKFNLSENERDVKIKIQLNKIKSSIEYILYDGFFTPEQENTKLTEYFIDTDYVIPIPDKLKNKFDGWYLNPEFTGNPVTELGKNNFVGNVKLYAKWTEIYKVSQVTNIKADTGVEKISLSWTNPAEPGLQSIEIECVEDSSLNTSVAASENKKDIIGLTPGKIYNFNITAVSKSGYKSKSMPISGFAVAPIKLTETVVSLPAGTEGTIGAAKTDGVYVQFGDYPQSVKAADVELSKNTVTVNGWTCYYGSDSAYYVKVKATPANDEAKKVFAKFNDKKTLINKDAEYYFKVEPLVWRVLDNDYLGNKGKLLFSEKIIGKCAFFEYEPGKLSTRTVNGKVIYNNNYEFSKVRAFMNGLAYLDKNMITIKDFEGKGFINNAFTANSLKEIQEINVDNSAATCAPNVGDKVCDNTNDKVFTLSYADIINTKYGFSSNYKENDPARNIVSTEYAKAIGVSYFEGWNESWWTTRTPNSNGSVIHRVTISGLPMDQGKCLYDSYGVVPAIVVGGTGYKTPPAEVSNLEFTTSKGTINLTWLPPGDSDFNRVEITCKENTGKNTSVAKGTNKASFTGLTNGQKYTFTLKTVDNDNSPSIGVTIEVPLYLRTESIVELPAGTAGSIGAADVAGTYVEFGDYPQTFVKNAPVTAESVTVGGLTYYYGSDGYYYVKAKANPSASSNSGKNFGDKDNTPIDNGGEYCFRVEPVKWRVIANTYGGTGGKVLLAENVLINSKFKSTTGAGANVYSSSELKTFVTGNMFNQLFSSTAQGNILPVNDTGAGLSNEKIFLLSKDDALNTSYGFVVEETANTARSRLTTDYSRALGAYSDINTKNGSWWLRTNAAENYVWIVGTVGGTGNSETVNNSSGGVVPAVVVK